MRSLLDLFVDTSLIDLDIELDLEKIFYESLFVCLLTLVLWHCYILAFIWRFIKGGSLKRMFDFFVDRG